MKEVTSSPNRKMIKLLSFDILFPPLHSLRSKRFHLVSEQRKTGFGRARNEMRAKKTVSALLLVPFFARSLTLVPRSLILNRTETLATQANHLAKTGLVL